MAEGFPREEAVPAEQRPGLGSGEYTKAADIMQTLGAALCTHKNVRVGDRLSLSVPMPSGASAEVDTYWMYMTHGGQGSGMNPDLHRTLLAEGNGLICAEVPFGSSSVDYIVAKPSAISPGHGGAFFAVLLGCDVGDASTAAGALARERNYDPPVTPDELCARLIGDPNVETAASISSADELELDNPRVFIWRTAEHEAAGRFILRPVPEHAVYHDNLRQLVQAVENLPPATDG